MSQQPSQPPSQQPSQPTSQQLSEELTQQQLLEQELFSLINSSNDISVLTANGFCTGNEDVTEDSTLTILWDDNDYSADDEETNESAMDSEGSLDEDYFPTSSSEEYDEEKNEEEEKQQHKQRKTTVSLDESSLKRKVKDSISHSDLNLFTTEYNRFSKEK